MQYDLLVQSPTWRSKVKVIMRAFFGMSSSRSSRGGDEILVASLCLFQTQSFRGASAGFRESSWTLSGDWGRLGSFRKHGVIDKVGFSCCSFNEADSGWSRLCSLGSSLGKTLSWIFDMLAIHCGDQSVPRSQLIPELVS